MPAPTGGSPRNRRADRARTVRRPSSVELTAIVSERGGLGSYGLYGYSPERIHDTIAELRAATDRPFAVNLWLPTGDEVAPATSISRPSLSALAPLYEAVGIGPARARPVPSRLRRPARGGDGCCTRRLERRLRGSRLGCRSSGRGIAASGASATATTVAEASSTRDAGWMRSSRAARRQRATGCRSCGRRAVARRHVRARAAGRRRRARRR